MAKLRPITPVNLPKKTEGLSKEADRLTDDPHYLQKLRDKSLGRK
jgi:hypothetical protein